MNRLVWVCVLVLPFPQIIDTGTCYKGPGRTSGDDVTSNNDCTDGGSGNTDCDVKANCEATTAAH